MPFPLDLIYFRGEKREWVRLRMRARLPTLTRVLNLKSRLHRRRIFVQSLVRESWRRAARLPEYSAEGESVAGAGTRIVGSGSTGSEGVRVLACCGEGCCILKSRRYRHSCRRWHGGRQSPLPPNAFCETRQGVGAGEGGVQRRWFSLHVLLAVREVGVDPRHVSVSGARSARGRGRWWASSAV